MLYPDGDDNNLSAVPLRLKSERKFREGANYEVTSFEYDANGRLTKTTLPDGHVLRRAYYSDAQAVPRKK